MANPYIVSCESTADMPASFFEERNIPVVLFHFILNGKEYDDDMGKTIPFSRFYHMMKDEGAEPTTALPSVAQYQEAFRPLLDAGNDILHLSFSSGLSGGYQSACIARDILKEEYPNQKILIVDSLGASSGFGLFVTAVDDKMKEGMTIEEAYEWAMSNRLKVHHWFFSTDLTNYLRGGRISRTSYQVGKILNICPLLNMDNLGHLIPRFKYPGKKRAIRECVERMKEHAQDGLAYSGRVYISNSDCLEDAIAVRDLVKANFPNIQGEIMINSIGTVIGSHTGPGTVALFFFGDERID